MGTEKEFQIDECVECVVRERDFSKKKVMRCQYCSRLLCERHIIPKVAFIHNFNPTNYPSEIEELYYKEAKRADGHPDLRYSQKRIEELNLEDKTRKGLIKQSLDRMNEHPIRRDRSSEHFFSSRQNNHRQKRRDYGYPRHRPSFHFSWKSKKLLKSLTFWLLLFWVTVGILFLAEGNKPTAFYNSVPEPIKYLFYIFAMGVSGWMGYKVFNRFDYNSTSDRGLFGLKLLSGVLLIAGTFLLVFGIFYQSALFIYSFIPVSSIARTTVSVFFSVLGFAFMLISAYLVFKFERRSGVIVYRR